MELKLNDHHHLLEAKARYGGTNEVALNSKSSYSPLDGIKLKISYTNLPKVFQVLFNGTYNEKHLLVDFIHTSSGLGFFPSNGGLTLRTPLQQLSSLDSSYNATMEDGHLQVSGTVACNNKDSVEVLLQGEAENGKHLLNMTIEHSFGRREAIHITSNFKQNSMTLDHSLNIKYGSLELRSSLKARTYDDLSFLYRMKTISPNPIKIEVEYHSKGKSLKSEIRVQNSQIAALHFEHSFSSSSLFKSILKAKFLLKKFELEAIKNENMTFAKAEVFADSRRLLYVKTKYLEGSDQSKETKTFEAHFLTPFDHLPVISFDGAIETEGEKRASTQIDFSYDGVSTRVTKHFIQNTNGSYHQNFNTTSDIEIIRKIFWDLRKDILSDGDERVVFDFALNDKNFSVTSTARPSKGPDSERSVRVRGPWGETEFQFEGSQHSGGASLSLAFIDSDGLQTQITGEYRAIGGKRKLTFMASNPITEPLEVTLELEGGSVWRGLLTAEGTESKTEYFHLSGRTEVQKTRLRGETTMNISFSRYNLTAATSADIGFNTDIASVLAGEGFDEIKADFVSLINAVDEYKISLQGKKTVDRLIANFALTSPIERYEKFDGELDIDLGEKKVEFAVMRGQGVHTKVSAKAMTDGQIDLSVDAILPIENYSTLGLSVQIDYENMHAQVEASREGHVTALAVSLSTKSRGYEGIVHLESSLEYWKTFDIQGRLDTNSGARVSLVGGSGEGSHKIEVEVVMGAEEGTATLALNLPIIDIQDKNIFVNYSLADGNYAVLANFSGDVVKVTAEHDGTAYRVAAVTPFFGLEQISSRITILDMDNRTSLDVFLEINGNVNTLIGYYNHMQNDFSFDLKTSQDLVRKLKLEFKEFKNAKEIVLAFNDHFVQTEIVINEGQKKSFIVYKSTGHDMVLNCEQSTLENHMTGKVKATYNGEVSFLETTIGNSQISVESESPFYYRRALQLVWREGEYELKLEHLDRELLFTRLKYDTAYYTGKIDFTFKIEDFNVERIYLATEYDLLKADKALDLKFDYGQFFFDQSSKWFMTHDTLDGVTFWKSSILDWEEAIFEGSYVIKAKSEIKFSVERNGVKQTTALEIEIKPNHFIPTVHIKTTFKGYESMKFSGDYRMVEGVEGEGWIEFLVERNTEVVMQCHSQIIVMDNWNYFDVNSVFAMLDRKNFTVLFHYEASRALEGGGVSPLKFKLEVQHGEEQLCSILGQVSLADMAFTLDIQTPIQDFEEFNFSGQFGATSIKSIAAFRRGRVKRDLSFDYNIDHHGARIDIKTPLNSMRRVRLAAEVMADSTVEFSFDTEGARDFSLGVKYNFVELMTSGNILAVFKCPFFNLDYRFAIDYHNIDGNFDNGFDVKFSGIYTILFICNLV